MHLKQVMQILGVCLFVLVLDVLTKAYTYFYIPPMAWSSPIYPYGGIPVMQNWHGIDFSINYVMNKGAAWGVLASLQQYLLYLRLFIIGGLLSYLVFCKVAFFRRFILSILATGAIGNVIDYFTYGHVVDMFYFKFWGYSYPVFNVADSAIFCSICLLFLQAMSDKVRSAKSARARVSKVVD